MQDRLSTYNTRLASLSPAEAGLVCSELCRRRVMPRSVTLESVAEIDPSTLPSLLKDCSILTADVISVLVPLASPVAQNALEKILGRPITLLPAQAAPPPPPPHEGAKPQVLEIGASGRRTIHNIKPNPKRAGTGAAERYNMYREGMQVADYLSSGGMMRDIAWDARQGFIELREAP